MKTGKSITNDEMFNILSLDYIKNYLRIDNNLDDEFLTECFKTAIFYANSVLGIRLHKRKYVSNDIKQALLYHIATIYQNKDGNHEIPKASNDIYNMHRDIKIGIE